MHAWKNKAIVNNFLTHTRKSIPFGGEQLDILLRLVSKTQPLVDNFIDLGCGDGILSHTILTEFPNARGLLLDYSEEMVHAARKRMNAFKNLNIVLCDISNGSWKGHIKVNPELIVSGYAIHHLTNNRKHELYKEIFDVLKPGGIFINMEHVASATALGTSLFDELMVDTLYAKLCEEGKEKNKSLLMSEHLERPDQHDNILALVTEQCDWLREIGFLDVDCFFKCFELAILGGIKKQE